MGYGRGRGGYSRVSLDNGGECLKYSLFIFNLLVLIGGLVLAIMGIIAISTDSYYRFHDFEDNNLFRSAAFIQIVVGFMVILFAFMGCLGAIRESKSLLLTYAVLTMIMFLLLLVAGVLAIIYRGSAKDMIYNKMKGSIANYGREDQDTKAWDTLQSQGECCGLDSYADWARYNPEQFATRLFPNSCCRNGSTCVNTDPANAWDRGCLGLVDDVTNFSTKLSWAAIVIAIIMLLAVVFACCVGCAL